MSAGQNLINLPRRDYYGLLFEAVFLKTIDQRGTFEIYCEPTLFHYSVIQMCV